MPESTTAIFVHEAGYREGRARGHLEGSCRQLRKLLLGLARQRFGPPADGSEAVLDVLEDRLALASFHELAERLVKATGWSEWTAGLMPAEQPPPLPEYVSCYEFNPEPPAAGFDEALKAQYLPGAGPPASPAGQATGFDTRHIIMHLRFQKWHEPDLDRKIYKTNCRLREKYRIERVESIVLLLFQNAEGPGLTGQYRVPSVRGKKFAQTFTYRIVRVWEKPPEEYLNAGLGTVMLAPLGNVREEQLPDVIQRMEAVVASRAKSPQEVALVWSATYWYMGLRYPADLVHRVLEKVLPLLREDKTYRQILAGGYVEGRSKGEGEGLVEATRTLIFRVGTVRLGPPPAGVQESVEALCELTALERMTTQILEAPDWADIVAKGKKA
jgi:hypothetical protein